MAAKKDTPGNDAWFALSSVPGVSNGGLDPLEEEDITVDKVTLLVAHIIKDSKYNILRANKFAKTSKRFLKNEAGALTHLLRLTNVENQALCVYTLDDFCNKVYHKT